MMKRHKLMNIILSVLWMITIIIMPVGAFAEGGNALSIEYVADGVPVSGTLFTIYRALDGTGNLTGDFEQYKEEIELGDFDDSEAMSILSDTLYAYSVRDKMIPLTAGMTNANGVVRFDKLETGVYLIVGATTKVGNIIYTIKPCIISLPYINDQEEEEPYVILTPKYAVRPVSSEEVSYSVMKVWKDQESLARPTEIEMELLENGEIVDTVILNKENDWRYTWEHLAPDSEFLVMESNVPKGYKVSITRNDTAFVITNTSNDKSSSIEGTEPPETETNETEPDPSETDTETNESDPSETESDPSETGKGTGTGSGKGSGTGSGSGTNTNRSTNSTPSSSNSNTAQISTLPQTGQLWWPVPVLFIAGIVLFLGGIVDYQLNRNEDT